MSDYQNGFKDGFDAGYEKGLKQGRHQGLKDGKDEARRQEELIKAFTKPTLPKETFGTPYYSISPTLPNTPLVMDFNSIPKGATRPNAVNHS